MTKFTTRAYNSIRIDKSTGLLVKSSNTERFRDEINYYRALPANLQSLFPKIHNVILHDSGESELYMEHIPYGTVSMETLYNGGYLLDFLSLIKQTLDKLHSHKHPTIKYVPKEHLVAMYERKTLDEYTKLVTTNQFFENLSNEWFLTINGKQYNNFEVIKTQVIDAISKYLYIDTPYTCVHGDFCFGNILFQPDSNSLHESQMKLIDPRGSWGQKGVYGDSRYDIAKLYHSFDGLYEEIVKDNFTLVVDNNEIDINFKNFRYNNIQSTFEEILGITDNRPYRLIEGLIYIGMCARHYDSLRRQQVMYSVGIRILNEVLTEYGYQ